MSKLSGGTRGEYSNIIERVGMSTSSCFKTKCRYWLLRCSRCPLTGVVGIMERLMGCLLHYVALMHRYQL